MPRNVTIMKFPTLNDRGGDLSRPWYVEWFYRVPGEEKPRYGRTSKGMCTGTATERREAAQIAIKRITYELKREDLLKPRPNDTTPVRLRDTMTRPEANRYVEFLFANDCKLLAEEYIEWKKPKIRPSSYNTYKSKVKIFTKWLTLKKPFRLPATLENKDIIEFFDWLADERHASHETIKRYKQAINDFYEWLRRVKELVWENPVHDIPNRGLLTDCAPEPISHEDSIRFRQAIEKHDPYLWLQCMLQYYCAIRPGHEIRLMRIRDINLENKTIVIPAENAKNKKRSVVAINDPIVRQIERLGIMSYDRDLYVFTKDNHPGEIPVGSHTMKERFNKIRDRLRINKQVKFYSWKHTGAISMVNNGVNVWQLQQHMRHASITTTEAYLKKRTPQGAEALNYIDEI